MTGSRWSVLLGSVAVVGLAALDSNLLAQGCAMCKTAVSAAEQASIAASLNLGIVTLLIPPLGIMTAILVLTFKRDR